MLCTQTFMAVCMCVISQQIDSPQRDSDEARPNAVQVYKVPKVDRPPKLTDGSNDPLWNRVPKAEVKYFHARGSEHHPETVARLAYDDQALYVLFTVKDRHVLCRQTEFQGPVCKDSCVEFFVQPVSGKGYFNFEVNCGGHLHVSYIEDCRRADTGFEKYTPVPRNIADSMTICHSLPERVDPEKVGDVEWFVAYSVPWSFFTHYVGECIPTAESSWSGNLYKCADDTSHPHWASWAPLGEVLDFHQPRFFGTFRFEGAQ